MSIAQLQKSNGNNTELRGAAEVIRVTQLSKSYSLGEVTVEALRSVSLSVQRGEFVAIMGPSGSGKSTFLNLLGCLDRPGSGSYLIDGQDVARLTENELAEVRSRKLGFVFQSFNLLSRTTARDNVALPVSYLRAARAASDRDLPDRLLAAVGLPERGRHTPAELSGGEQQRIALARSLVNGPSIILADEPTGNLDTARSREIMLILAGLNNAGITIVLVTHEPDIAAYAKRLIHFRDGSIVSDEPVDQLPESRAARLNVDFLRKGAAEGSVASVHTQSVDRLSFSELLAHVKAAVLTLWHNRLRSTLTALGILIGVAAVIAMMAVGQGSQKDVQTRIEQLGSNLLSIRPGSAASGMAQLGAGSAETLTIEDADAISAKIANLSGIAPEVVLQTQVQYGRTNWSTSVTGTTAAYPVVHSWTVARGTFFTEGELQGRQAVCVLGSDVAATLYPNGDPIGTTVRIKGAGYRVIGVMSSRGGGGFGNQDDVVFVPVTTAMARLTGPKQVRSIAVSVTSRDDMVTAKSDITALLRQRHGIQTGRDADFTIFSQEDILTAMQGVSQTLTLLLASVAAISLVVGGIGIMNIMLVSVTERTREIGLRKALGARPKDIMQQFLTEAIILSGLGGVLGWILGVVASYLIQVLGKTTTVVTPATVLLALGFALAVGVFFGIFPARKAASLDPIRALRYE